MTEETTEDKEVTQHETTVSHETKRRRMLDTLEWVRDFMRNYERKHKK